MKDEDREFSDQLADWMREQFGWEAGKRFSWKDDWTLIVKLHAMIETGLNGAILRELDRPSLASVIAKLDTSNQSTGKAAFAKALGILPGLSVKFLQKLSELRNLCVHDIKHFDFDLIRYLEAAPDKRSEFKSAVYKMVNPETPTICPQEGLIIGTMCLLSELMVHNLRCESRRLEGETLHLKAKRFDEHE